MLAAHEFTVGPLSSAGPLSLILPRNNFEATVLIGRLQDVPAAVFLEGQYANHFFESADNTSWSGLIIPNVCIEVDETSVSDGGGLGSLVRKSTTLGIRVKRDRGFDDGATVTLHNGLADAGDHRATFQKWQIVIGIDANKRVLWRSPE